MKFMMHHLLTNYIFWNEINIVNKEIAITNPDNIFQRFKTYVYTFFDITNPDTTIDEKIIHTLIESNLIHLCKGFITDDYRALYYMIKYL